MKPPAACLSAALSPSGNFEAVPAIVVQQVLRQWFEQWGRPQQIQFDHGQPWHSGGADLPSLFELWLVGLGISVVWSRPRHPQDNGIVERSHRTTQAWSAPKCCRDLHQLQHSLDETVRLQRELYPNEYGLTRLQRYPQLLHQPRPYQTTDEEQLWSCQQVCTYLAQGCWQRKVDASGRVSLYNHNYTVSRAHAGQTVWVRFDAHARDWLFFDTQSHLIARCPSLEINPDVIRQLRCHRPSSLHQSPSSTRHSPAQPLVAPPT